MKDEIYFYGRQESSVDFDGQRYVQHAPVTSLTSGNRLVNVNWQSSGFFPDSLMAIPALNWFSQKHQALLQFGWFNVSLIVNGHKTNVWQSRTWNEEQSILRSQFGLEKEFGQMLDVNAAGVCPDGEQAFVYSLDFKGLQTGSDLEVIVRIKGAISFGKEVGRLFDGAGNMVTRGPGKTPEVSVDKGGFEIFQKDAGLFSILDSNVDSSLRSYEIVPEPKKEGCDVVEFEMNYPVFLKDRESSVFNLYVFLGNSEEDVFASCMRVKGVSSDLLCKESALKWKERASDMLEVSMPVKILEAGFKQGLFYAENNAYDFDGMTILHADHCSFPLDLSRDSFFISIALLYLDPEITKRHLRFYFEKAIPRCGLGTSYIASCPWESKAGHFLLDAVIYPIFELHRYWCFTGDNEYIKEKSVRDGIDAVLSALSGVFHKELGLYSSEGRSSDEACVYPFFVPANMMLVVMFEYLSEIFGDVYGDSDGVEEFQQKADALRHSIEMHCVIKDKEFGDIYAFEIDGKGNSLLYDHADMPNLLTAPWYGYCSKDAKVYKNTLEFIYSSRNEGFKGVMDGRFSSLCDGSKTMPDGPWPMSAMGKILAGFGDSENVREMLDLIASSMCDNLLIPEIIDKNSARTRSRRWFAWPPALFVTCFIEGVCGIKALKDSVSIAPVIPDGWESFCSPQIKIKGKTVKVCIDNGKERVFINGHETDKRILKI